VSTSLRSPISSLGFYITRFFIFQIFQPRDSFSSLKAEEFNLFSYSPSLTAYACGIRRKEAAAVSSVSNIRCTFYSRSTSIVTLPPVSRRRGLSVFFHTYSIITLAFGPELPVPESNPSTYNHQPCRRSPKISTTLPERQRLR